MHHACFYEYDCRIHELTHPRLPRYSTRVTSRRKVTVKSTEDDDSV